MRSRISILEPGRRLSLLPGCFCLALSIVTGGLTATVSTPVEEFVRGNLRKQVSLASRELAGMDQKDSEPRQAMDRADKLRANWTKASLQEAIELYDKAALLW